MTTASLSFAALTIDSADPAALADFWGKVLGLPATPGSTGPSLTTSTTTSTCPWRAARTAAGR